MNLVYFVSEFTRYPERSSQAPWFVISGTGNLDVPRNQMPLTVVAAKDVFKAIDNYDWVDSPYVVSGHPATTQQEAEQILDQLQAKERQRWREEMEWQDKLDAKAAAVANDFWDDEDEDYGWSEEELASLDAYDE